MAKPEPGQQLGITGDFLREALQATKNSRERVATLDALAGKIADRELFYLLDRPLVTEVTIMACSNGHRTPGQEEHREQRAALRLLDNIINVANRLRRDDISELIFSLAINVAQKPAMADSGIAQQIIGKMVRLRPLRIYAVPADLRLRPLIPTAQNKDSWGIPKSAAA